MKSVSALIILASSANAFAPSLNSRTCSVTLQAKHANNKAAKKAAHNRPRKSRPSDIHRTPVVYDEIIKPPEYTILDSPSDVGAPSAPRIEMIEGTSLGMMMDGDTMVGWVGKSAPQGTFDAVDWDKALEERDVLNEPAEDDVLAWLERQSDEDAIAWLKAKVGDGADEDGEGGEVSLEEMGLPAGAELIEIEDDKVLVFE